MDSLYGGRPGAPFVLKASFKTIDDMKQEFGKGPAYTGVWYNEYCIIDTENKDHRDNGKIYQRTPDYSNEMSGARYIGQIVGPQASSPELDLDSLDELKDYKENTPLEDGEVRTWVYGEDSNSLSWYTDATNDATVKKPDVYIKQLTVGDGLVSGENCDSIDYAWVTTRKADNSIATTKVGLQIPYPYIKFTVNQDSTAYSTVSAKKITEIELDGGGTKKLGPFYNSWELTIPRGKKGDSIRNIRIGIYKTKEGDESSDSVDGVSIEEIKNPLDNSLYFYDSSNKDSAAIAGGRYWLGDWYSYDESEAGSKTTYCFGEAPKQKLSYNHWEGSDPENANLSWFDISDTNSAGPQAIPVNEVVSLFANVGEGKDNQLYALYSSAESRANDKDVTGYVKGSQLVGSPEKWGNLNWKALGGIKDDSGLLTGHEINASGSEFRGDQNKDTVLTWLNENRMFTRNNGTYSCENDPTLTDGKLVFCVLGSFTYLYAWDYSEWDSSEGAELTQGHWKLMGRINSGGTDSNEGVGILEADAILPSDNSWYFPAENYNICDQPSCTNWWGTVYNVEDTSSPLPSTGTGSTLYITEDGIFKWDSTTSSYKNISTTSEYVDAKVKELADSIIALTASEIDEADDV